MFKYFLFCAIFLISCPTFWADNELQDPYQEELKKLLQEEKELKKELQELEVQMNIFINSLENIENCETGICENKNEKSNKGDKLESQTSQTEADLAYCIANLTSLKGEQSLQKRNIDQLESNLNETHIRLRKSTAEVKELKKMNEIQQQNNITLNKEIMSLESKLNSQAANLKDKENQIAQLEKDVKALQENLRLEEGNKIKQEKLCTQQQESKNEDIEILRNLPNSFTPTLCLPADNSTNYFTMKLANIESFDVFCLDGEDIGPGWSLVQRKFNKGSEDFNRYWLNYKFGFGNSPGEFFLGLEKLHRITSSQLHELYISLKDYQDRITFARYSYFLIGNEKENYKLKSLGEYTGNAGDGMRINEGMQFSTPDADHDKKMYFTWDRNSNCAKQYQAGWWFYDCGLSNLNGPIIKWGNLYPKYKEVLMMIRPVKY